ncbi:TPA: hypothetical protein UMF74_000450 [Stenotrophomonas maltophilia]|jgi:hypothetical protein|nr:hypothetical protein [Stenotrophomonas maltophilia]
MAQSLVIAVLVLTVIFGPIGLDFADDGGSSADWLAALGTWVIGIAAGAIAYMAHRRNERDAESQEERRSELQGVQRMQVAILLSTPHGLSSLPQQFKELKPERQTIGNLKLVHERLLRDAKEVVIGDQYLSCLTTEIVVEIASINNKLEYVRDLIEMQRIGIARRPAIEGKKPMAIAWDLDLINQIEEEAIFIRDRCQWIFDKFDEL